MGAKICVILVLIFGISFNAIMARKGPTSDGEVVVVVEEHVVDEVAPIAAVEGPEAAAVGVKDEKNFIYGGVGGFAGIGGVGGVVGGFPLIGGLGGIGKYGGIGGVAGVGGAGGGLGGGLGGIGGSGIVHQP